jgi:hypothetical protein
MIRAILVPFKFAIFVMGLLALTAVGIAIAFLIGVAVLLLGCFIAGFLFIAGSLVLVVILAVFLVVGAEGAKKVIQDRLDPPKKDTLH